MPCIGVAPLSKVADQEKFRGERADEEMGDSTGSQPRPRGADSLLAGWRVRAQKPLAAPRRSSSLVQGPRVRPFKYKTVQLSGTTDEASARSA